METVGQPPAQAELHLLTDWSDPDAPSRHRKAAAGAIAINVALVVVMWWLPETLFRPPELIEPVERITPLVMPELTQRDPNPGKVKKEFEVQASAVPRRAIQMPPSPAPLKGEEVPKPAPPPPLPEPPKLETAHDTPTPDLLREVQQTAPLPPPQIQTAEKPRLTFENPPTPRSVPLPPEQRQIPLPTASIGDIARSAVLGTPVGTIIGDPGAWGSGYNGMSQSSTPGNPAAAVQLRSDAGGADLKPYLTQLIATIKRNWLAVIPQAARMGQRGKVAILLVIAKNGNMDKVAIAEYSGSNALDRAAVAGVSMSVPLLPLPREYTGTRIVLQLNFVYW
jgi:TonB family protein